jgi:hypothetical protein
VVEAIANEEAPGARCEGCPIRSKLYCPDIDALSVHALVFSNHWDHPAHEAYREALWPLYGPHLAPSKAVAWLERREAIVGTLAELRADALRNKPQGSNPNGE